MLSARFRVTPDLALEISFAVLRAPSIANVSQLIGGARWNLVRS